MCIRDRFGTCWVSPVYKNGKLYFGNETGVMYCVLASTGQVVWSYETESDNLHASGKDATIVSNPCFDDDNVYVGSTAGFYYAWPLNATTNTPLWQTYTLSSSGYAQPDSAAPMVYGDYVYVQKEGKYIAAINRTNGVIEANSEWQVPAGALQNGTVAASGNMVFGSYIDGRVYMPYNATIAAFDIENNDLSEGPIWTHDGGGGLTAPVTTSNKVIFGSTADMFVTCLDTATGNVIWRTYTGGEMLENVPAIYGDKVFLRSKNGWVYAIE